MADAAALSKEFPGAKFFVLEAIWLIHVPKPEGEPVQENAAAEENLFDKPF